MTALKGLLEACVLLAVAVAVAAVLALAWILIGSGEFLGRLGICLLILGILFSVLGDMTLTRMASSDAFAWFGAGPERASRGLGEGKVLTAIGVFLFVGLPLIIAGGALAAI